MNDDEKKELMEYRLSAIEKTLEEVRAFIVEDRMQSRDIADLQKSQAELLQAINAHDKRLRAVEERPMNEKASRYAQIVDMAFKTMITVAISLVLAKVGLQAAL